MQRRKRGLTAQQRQELWARWKEGQTLTEIGNALGKVAGSIHGLFLMKVVLLRGSAGEQFII